MTTKKLSPGEITEQEWIIDRENETVQHRHDPFVDGKIVQVTCGVVRDRKTGKPSESEVLLSCELDDGRMVILDQSEPW